MNAPSIRDFAVRPARPDDTGSIEELRRSSLGASICPRTACTLSACAGCPPSEQWRTAVVAAARNGIVVAAAWIDPCKGDSRQAHLGLLVHPRYRNAGIEQALLVSLVARARETGLTALTACVFHDVPNALLLFEDAGLEVLSSLSVGGVSEVVLRIAQP